MLLQKAINYHLQITLNILHKRDKKNFIGVRIACMLGENPLHYYFVLEIPKKLWGKLGAFMDVKDMVVQGDRDDYLLAMTMSSPDDCNKMVASLKTSVESFAKYSFLKLEDKIPGLYVELMKQSDNAICFKFSAKSDNEAQPSLAATQLAAANMSHKLDDNTENLLKNLMSAVKQISTVNKKFFGFVTASFLCQKEAKGAPYFMKLEFDNLAIASFVRSRGKYDFLNKRYIVKPLDQHSYYNANFLQEDDSLILPITVFSENADPQAGEVKLSTVLSIRANKITEYLPFSFCEVEGQVLSVKNPFPYTLVQRFSLGKPTKGDGYFSYPAVKSLTDIVGELFEDRFNLESTFVKHFQSYNETDKACQELSAVAKAKGNDVVAAFEGMVNHCNEKIELSKKISGRYIASSIFGVSESDKQTNLLHQSIANFEKNLKFNYHAKYRIQTLQQLINTQEKRKLAELCGKERKDAGGDTYDKVRKNSALLLLEHHLMLSHPAYTANDMWENIETNPVECYGTEKNYMNESGDKKLTLGVILNRVPKIQNALSLLVTSNDVVVQASTEKIM